MLGLGSRWGLVRYWWVATLAINVVLTGLVLVSLQFEVAARAERARHPAAGQAVTFDLSNLICPPTVSLAFLLIAMTLSVVKPLGRIRPRRSAVGTESG